MKDLEKYINDELVTSLETKKGFVEKNLNNIVKVAELMVKATKNGGKVLYFGNGGSAADAQHLAAEHVNKLRVERSALAAMALTTDTSIITSVANDIGLMRYSPDKFKRWDKRTISLSVFRQVVTPRTLFAH